MAVAYSVNQWASLRVYANFEQRDSSGASVADYQKLDSGIGASALFRF
jgi:hypothetical protein